MPPIDKRLKVLDIVLPDVMPPVVEGYVPAFAPFVLLERVLKSKSSLNLRCRRTAGEQLRALYGRRAVMQLTGIHSPSQNDRVGLVGDVTAQRGR